MLATMMAAVAAFLLLPYAEAYSLGVLPAGLLLWYGPQNLDLMQILWRVLLALSIFAAVRALLQLIFSAAGLALALRVLAATRRER